MTASRNRLAALLCLVSIVVLAHPASAATTLLPNGKQCFADANGPIISGSINMFIPNTTTPKATWQDSGQVTLNSQPIQLDSNGCAIIYGTGIYRQQLFDGPVVSGVTSGNLIWDQLTTDTSAFNSVFWAGIAGGTPNAITVVDAGFNGTDGTVIQFTALSTNTASTTINPSGYANILVQKDTAAGPVSLTGGEIVQGNIISVVYSASGNAFHLLNLVTAASSASPPLCGAVGLQIVNDPTFPNSKINITADQIVMQNLTGQYITRNNVSVSVNFTTIGAGGLDVAPFSGSTWYNLYAIDNGVAPNGLGSLSATAPTSPSGYSYRCRLGAMLTNSSGQFFRTIQKGSWTQWQVIAGSTTTVMPTLVSAANASYTIFSVAAGAPPTATDICLVATNSTNSSNWGVAPNTGYGFATSGNPSPLAWSSAVAAQPFLNVCEMLETPNLYEYSNTGTLTVFATKWKDKVNAN